MLLFIKKAIKRFVKQRHFKTSYVTVYQMGPGYTEDACRRFQNIVCYCLSRTDNIEFEQLMSFQNIVCYCLSTTVRER